MFYFNKIKGKKTITKFLELKNYELNKNNSKIYNFDVKNGNLTTSFGFSTFTLPESEDGDDRTITISSGADVGSLYHYKYYDEVGDEESHKIFWNNSNNFLEYCGVFDVFETTDELSSLTTLADVPVGINYSINGTNYMLFCTNNRMYKFSNIAVSESVLAFSKFIDIAGVYGKLFAVLDDNSNKIYYSTELDPFVWTGTESSIILPEERGKINKLMCFDDFIFAFRDYGITKIFVSRSDASYNIYDLYFTSSKIYSKTIVKCGDDILFLEKDGIFQFNGKTTKKIGGEFLQNYFENVSNEDAVACFNEGKYFLACRLNFDDTDAVGCENFSNGFTNNALIVYDVETSEIKLVRGVDIKSMLSLSTKNLSTILVSFNGEFKKKIGKINKTGEIFGTHLSKVWVSEMENFDLPELNKIVKEIYINSTSDAIVTIITEEETQSFVVVGGEKLQRLRTFVKGKNIQVKITSSSASKIMPIKLKLQIIKNEV